MVLNNIDIGLKTTYLKFLKPFVGVRKVVTVLFRRVDFSHLEKYSSSPLRKKFEKIKITSMMRENNGRQSKFYIRGTGLHIL